MYYFFFSHFSVEDSQTHPVIQQHDDTTFKVIIEEETVMKTTPLFSAFEVYFASFYVFNLSYPKKLREDTAIFPKAGLEHSGQRQSQH